MYKNSQIVILSLIFSKIDSPIPVHVSKEETDSVYIATTDLINLINKMKNNNILTEDLEKNLKDQNLIYLKIQKNPWYMFLIILNQVIKKVLHLIKY